MRRVEELDHRTFACDTWGLTAVLDEAFQLPVPWARYSEAAGRQMDIIYGMARAFFNEGWVRQAEAAGVSFPGQQEFDVMPALDQWGESPWQAAADLYDALAARNGCSTVTLCWGDDVDEYDYETGSTFGHYAVMSALGHGVGLWEFERWAHIVVPHRDFDASDLARNYFTEN